MTSNEKRRDVAAKLRAEAESWRSYREDDDAFCMNDSEFTEAVLEDFGFTDMDMPAYEVFDQMADIVDRPTCTMTYKPEWSGDEIYPTSAYQCSNCGSVVNEGITEYCPSCGCRVSNFETEFETEAER